MEWAAKNIRKANIGVKVVYEWVDEPTADLTVESLMERTYWGADIEVLRHYLESVLGGNIGSEYTQPQGRIIYNYFDWVNIIHYFITANRICMTHKDSANYSKGKLAVGYGVKKYACRTHSIKSFA